MGAYLNSTAAYTLYKGESEEPYFVDKTQMLEDLFPLIKKETAIYALQDRAGSGKL